MSLKDIKKLGDPILRKAALPVDRQELVELKPAIEMMWETITEFREKYGRGRAIAAPQVGLSKRIICLVTDKKHALINPVIESRSEDMIELWDDCMSFPNLLVRLKRNRCITLSFYSLDWEKVEWNLEDDMSELIQHEYDHLDGILAVDRAIDKYSLRWIEDHESLPPLIK